MNEDDVRYIFDVAAALRDSKDCANSLMGAVAFPADRLVGRVSNPPLHVVMPVHAGNVGATGGRPGRMPFAPTGPGSKSGSISRSARDASPYPRRDCYSFAGASVSRHVLGHGGRGAIPAPT